MRKSTSISRSWEEKSSGSGFPALERIENQQEFSGLGLHFLLGASEELGAGGTFGENSEVSRIVDFRANSVVEIPNLDIFDYSHLEPNYLYNMFDFKFHAKDESLESTGLPAALALTSPNRLGRYHVLTAGGMVPAGN
jgi:hypothetical protein